ncbi:MAG: sigma-70 family RNA polymerase sigma factor [Thermoanaerobaculia bacterium]
MQQSSTADLALAVHRREPGSFERLVERFEASLFNYAHRILGNPFDAQEVVQDAFLRAHDALTRRYESSRAAELALRPWLFRIARNLCFNKRRGRKTKLDEPLSSFDDSRIGPLVPPSSVGAALEARQEKEALDRALATLPAESRELIILRFMEEMSYAEISKTLGAEETVLRGRVFRSLKLLRQALDRSEVTHAV